ncbi:hypothetical protein A2U01_0059852, partial [Trifolium medium]|nr:hypothetical protein [Trifolium medium]
GPDSQVEDSSSKE